MSGLLYSSDRPEFVERLAKLAGGTTYRVPTEGKGTKFDQLPDAHAIAGALAFSRRGPDDIGPDVAYCWVLRTDAYRERVVRKLATALRCHEFRNAGEARVRAAEVAWEAMIWGRSAPKPAEPPKFWDAMLLTAIGVLHASAWDSLAEAERRYHRAA